MGASAKRGERLYGADLSFFVSAGLNDSITVVERQNIDFISSVIVSIETKSLAFEKGLLVRDPDGHAVRVIE